MFRASQQSTVQPSPSTLTSGADIGAFFDVDNTLVPGAAIELRFFCYLYAQGLVGVKEAAFSLRVLLGSMPPFSLQPLRERKPYLVGKHPGVIEPLADEFVRRQVIPRLAPDGLATLDAHRQAGHALVLLTGSLDFLITPLAGVLDVKTVLAARPERTCTGYTGQIVPPLPYGEGKRRLVEGFARQHKINLHKSYAYGDSPGDMELLSAVGHPHAVNPIRGMAKIARRRGWPILWWN